MAKMTSVHFVHKNKGFAPQAPENWESRMGGFQEGDFQIVERAALSSRGNLLLQGNSYLKSTLRLLLRRRV